MLKTAVAIRHVAFEGLGTFEPVLRNAGYTVHYYDAGVDPLWTLEPFKTDLVIVLGGPIAAYDGGRYPFLADELNLLEVRLAAARPTLGICLGAQLMAHAMGARVYPGQAREIGWGPVRLTEQGLVSPLHHLGRDGVVLHWHGDTFDLPHGAERLASTDLIANQAFAVGPNTLGLQFHPEAVGADIERWLVGHAAELSASGVDPARLRADAERYGADLELRAGLLLNEWLNGLDRR